MLSHHVPLDPLIENSPNFSLRVDFLLKTDGGYPKDAEGLQGATSFSLLSVDSRNFSSLSLSVCQRSEDGFYHCSERNNAVVWFG